MEAYSVAKAVEEKHDYKIDANQELKALGLSNIIGSIFQSYPTNAKFQILLFIVTASLMNPIIASLAPDGKFPFLWSNFYCMLAIVSSITFALKTKKPLKIGSVQPDLDQTLSKIS